MGTTYRRAARVLAVGLGLVLQCACQAVAPPTPPLRIALDVGHAPASPGALSARGVSEWTFNRRLVQELHGAMQRAGFEAFLIEEGSRSLELAERARFATEHGAELLLSIHHDSVQPAYRSAWTFEGAAQTYSDRFRGYSLFYSGTNVMAASSLRLATRIGRQLRSAGFAPTLHHAEPIPGENRLLVDEAAGVYRFDDLVVLRSANVPAVLIECGVIAHRLEEEDLDDPAFRGRFVSAIVAALRNFER